MRYVKQVIALTSDAWTPVAPPVDMDYFSVRCTTGQMKIRTDQNDATTEDVVLQGIQESVMGNNVLGKAYPMLGAPMTQSRFPAGITAFWLQSVSPTGTAIVTWVL